MVAEPSEEFQEMQRRLEKLEETHASFKREVNLEKEAFMDQIQAAFVNQQNQLMTLTAGATLKFEKVDADLRTLFKMTEQAVHTLEERVTNMERSGSGGGGPPGQG